jgi:UPF0716 protein FxsA
MWLIAAFVLIPIAELALLLKVGEWLGPARTIFLVVVTGVVGATLAKTQGLMVLREIQKDLAEGRVPAPRLIDGVMILIAGILLITPGLATDTAGFLLLLPPVRKLIRAWLKRWFERKMAEGSANITIWR